MTKLVSTAQNKEVEVPECQLGKGALGFLVKLVCLPFIYYEEVFLKK